MTRQQLEGMQARADGKGRDANPYHLGKAREQWFAGHDYLTLLIRDHLKTAKDMLDQIEQLHQLGRR